MGQVLRSKIISPDKQQKGHPKASKRVYPAGRYGATLRDIRTPPNKVRLVIDQIRGEPVERAREVLRYSQKRAAYHIDRVLLSALGNADVKSGGRVGAAELFVAEAYCDVSQRLKRWKAGPMGRARPILRRSCHITVVLGEAQQEEEKAD
jgi:large subunit ribosomal protein L22